MSLQGNTPTDADPEQLSDYYERKVAGACTRYGCPSAAHDDLGLCLPHLQDARGRKAKLRSKRRRAGLCVDCGDKAPRKRGSRKRHKARCRSCSRGNTKQNRGNNQHAPLSARAAATIITVEGDGYTRTRYLGQGKRGRSTKASESKRDINEAIKTLERAREALAAIDDPNIGPLEKKSRVLEVTSLVKLAGRFGDEVLERHE